MGSLGWAGAAQKPHAGGSDGDTAIELPSKVVKHSSEASCGQQLRGYSDTAIELLSEVINCLVLVWFGRQRGMKNWVCDGLDFVLGAVGGLLCARGRRVSRCGPSGGPASRD